MARLRVDGMRCSSCENRIHNELVRLHGVLGAHASASEGIVEVLFDGAVLAVDDVRRTVDGAGRGSYREYVVREAVELL